MNFDKKYILAVIENILNTHSPTGFTGSVMDKCAEYAAQLGCTMERDNKGTGYIQVKGRSSGKAVGVCAHVDTLGLMVRSVNAKGTLALTEIGGMLIPTVDGEYCTVFTRDGREYTGTVLCDVPSSHVYSDAGSKKREIASMEVRLDEAVRNKEDVHALGIGVGDYVCIDTKTKVLQSGFIKSRFLDDKLGVGIVFGILKYFKDEKVVPANDVVFVITVYEEVGHGMACVPDEIDVLIGVDMGCIGSDLSGTEFDVCICAKDSGGPYDYELTSELISIAKKQKLNHAVDIFKYYGSDVTSALRAGNNVRGALIGPGVHASHGMERGHYDGVLNTLKLLALYLS